MVPQGKLKLPHMLSPSPKERKKAVTMIIRQYNETIQKIREPRASKESFISGQ